MERKTTALTSNISVRFSLGFVGLLLAACTIQKPHVSPLPRFPALAGHRMRLAYALDTLIEHSGVDMAFWGVSVREAGSDRVIYERNARRLFMPASNMKLYTTAAALCLLGPDFRYATTFYIDGEITPDSVLRGNLIIRGSGDPTWSWRFYDHNYDSLYLAFADSLLAHGVRRIDGDIIGDDDVFTDEPLGYGWSWDDEPYYYAAQITGLSYNENYVDIRITPTKVGSPVKLEKFPPTSYLQLDNELITTDVDTLPEWKSGRERGRNLGWFRGWYPRSTGVKWDALTVENPTLFTVWVLKEYLQRAGIEVRGQPRDGDDILEEKHYDDRWKPLFTHYSPPLSEIIAKVNKPSQNFIAECLQRTLGAMFRGEGSNEAGIEVEMALFDSLGMDTQNLTIVDGSGLSRHNLVAPANTVSLLQMMWRHPYRAIYMASLATPGEEHSTLAHRMQGTPLEGNLWAKTGYMEYVRSLSGYLLTRHKKWLVFSLMVNHYTIPTREINRIQDRICLLLERY